MLKGRVQMAKGPRVGVSFKGMRKGRSTKKASPKHSRLLTELQQLVSNSLSRDALTPAEVERIRMISRGLPPNKFKQAIETATRKVSRSPKQFADLVKRESEGRTGAGKGATSDTEQHPQIMRYNEIRTDPNKFITENPKIIQDRIIAIDAVINKLEGKAKEAALFNREFFKGCLDYDRPRLRFIDDTGFFDWPSDGDWPDTTPHGKRRFELNDLERVAGVLSELGYNAQKDGPGITSRRRILSGLIEGKIDLPNGFDREYLDGWGEPMHSGRLKKIAYSIAAFCRQQKAKRFASEQAVAKWESDLDYLRQRYYGPMKARFEWPET